MTKFILCPTSQVDWLGWMIDWYVILCVWLLWVYNIKWSGDVLLSVIFSCILLSSSITYQRNINQSLSQNNQLEICHIYCDMAIKCSWACY